MVSLAALALAACSVPAYSYLDPHLDPHFDAGSDGHPIDAPAGTLFFDDDFEGHAAGDLTGPWTTFERLGEDGAVVRLADLGAPHAHVFHVEWAPSAYALGSPGDSAKVLLEKALSTAAPRAVRVELAARMLDDRPLSPDDNHELAFVTLDLGGLRTVELCLLTRTATSFFVNVVPDRPATKPRACQCPAGGCPDGPSLTADWKTLVLALDLASDGTYAVTAGVKGLEQGVGRLPALADDVLQLAVGLRTTSLTGAFVVEYDDVHVSWLER
ncbi:MAG: hypothetical protein NVS3B10_12700 [Polyangiales bacterium]